MARVGHAFLLSSGKPVYREEHDPSIVDGKLEGDRVRYVAPDGKLIARKEVDFSRHPLYPQFRLVDRRTGYVEGLIWRGDRQITLFHREGTNARREHKMIEVPPKLAADAGFDVLIYRHFNELKAGKTLRFPFAVPSRLETITFRLRMIGRRRIMGQPAVVVRMEPDSTLLRWLVDPIDVAYQADSGALLRYEGVSNLPDPDHDGNYRVRIDFPPPGEQPVPPGPPSNQPPAESPR